jgi:hypothetical protein
MSDTNSRSIILSLAAVLFLTVAAVIASLLIPFNVDEPASLQPLAGDVEIITPGQPPINATDQATLNINQTLNVPPGSQAQITFDLDDGRARLVLNGPASLTLVKSYHRATALGHALNRRRYVLTLQQTQGSIDYFFADFANMAPSSMDADIAIELPNGSYAPDSPCWRIDIPLTGQTSTTPIDCKG